MFFNTVMMVTTIVLTVFLRPGETTYPKTQPSMEDMIRATCLDKTGFRPVESDNALFRPVEAVEGDTVTLACSFCGESVADEPRVWWRRARAENASEQELRLGLSADPETDRLAARPDHTLVVRNVGLADAGAYACGAPARDVPEFRFGLDLVPAGVAVLEAKTAPWPRYQERLTRANEQLYESAEPEVRGLLDRVKVKVVAEWDPWSPCDGCESVRRRYAKCRLRSHPHERAGPPVGAEELLLRAAVVSCHSLDLARWFPAVHSATSAVPDYREEQTCVDGCEAAARLAHEARYGAELRVDLGSSLAFVCPDSELGSRVVWKKDGVTMKPVGFRVAKKSSKIAYYKRLFKRPVVKLERAFVDRMNTLQLCSVGPDESAVYTCYVDKRPVKSLNVTVVTAEETLRQRRYHFWLLSCYTSLLSAIVVGNGVLWAFLRKHEFIQIHEE